MLSPMSEGFLARATSSRCGLAHPGLSALSATGWSLEKLRCDTCGELFSAPAPPEAGATKYAESAEVTVAMLRYGSGLPHYRLARLQASLGCPCRSRPNGNS